MPKYQFEYDEIEECKDCPFQRTNIFKDKACAIKLLENNRYMSSEIWEIPKKGKRHDCPLIKIQAKEGDRR